MVSLAVYGNVGDGGRAVTAVPVLVDFTLPLRLMSYASIILASFFSSVALILLLVGGLGVCAAGM